MPPSGPSPIRRGGALLALALLLPTAACYRYRTAPPAALTDGAQVRLRLTAAGGEALTPVAGLSLRELSGTVQGVLADSALVVMPSDVITVDGDELPWRRGTLTIPLRALGGSEQRTISRRRTAGVIGAMAAAFGGVVYYALRSISGGGGSTVAPGPSLPE